MPAVPRIFNFRSGKQTNAAPYRKGSYLYNLLKQSGPAGGGGYGGAGGGAGGGYGGLYGQYQKALDDANAANKKRETEIRGLYDTTQTDTLDPLSGDVEGSLQGSRDLVGGLRSRLEGSLDSSRDMARGMADQEVSEARTLGRQFAYSRGMQNTTVNPSLSAGYGARARDVENRYRLGLESENRGIQSQLTGQSLGLEQEGRGNLYRDASLQMGFDADRRGFVERINDLGPDFNQMIGLADRMGQGAGGQGGMMNFGLQGGMLGGGRGLRGLRGRIGGGRVGRMRRPVRGGRVGGGGGLMGRMGAGGFAPFVGTLKTSGGGGGAVGSYSGSRGIRPGTPSAPQRRGRILRIN